MAPQPAENLEAWLFSLNPGYRIDRIAVVDEVMDDDDYEFKDGILRIPTAKSGESGNRAIRQYRAPRGAGSPRSLVFVLRQCTGLEDHGTDTG